VDGDSGRRKLQNWVKKNHPEWPQVPDLVAQGRYKIMEFDMGCYSQWYAYGFSTQAEFERERRQQYEKFASLKHVVDYYVAIAQKQLPGTSYAGYGSVYDLVSGEDLADEDYTAICKHLACDGLHFSALLDVETIINRENPEACRYAYVLMQCMSRLRSSGPYYTDRTIDLPTVSELEKECWFVEEPH
jgi:hypothetical protein